MITVVMLYEWQCLGLLNKPVDDLVMNQSDGQHHVHHLHNLVERTAPFVEHGTFSKCSISLFCYWNTNQDDTFMLWIFPFKAQSCLPTRWDISAALKQVCLDADPDTIKR